MWTRRTDRLRKKYGANKFRLISAHKSIHPPLRLDEACKPCAVGSPAHVCTHSRANTHTHTYKRAHNHENERANICVHFPWTRNRESFTDSAPTAIMPIALNSSCNNASRRSRLTIDYRKCWASRSRDVIKVWARECASSCGVCCSSVVTSVFREWSRVKVATINSE